MLGCGQASSTRHPARCAKLAHAPRQPCSFHPHATHALLVCPGRDLRMGVCSLMPCGEAADRPRTCAVRTPPGHTVASRAQNQTSSPAYLARHGTDSPVEIAKCLSPPAAPPPLTRCRHATRMAIRASSRTLRLASAISHWQPAAAIPAPPCNGQERRRQPRNGNALGTGCARSTRCTGAGEYHSAKGGAGGLRKSRCTLALDGRRRCGSLLNAAVLPQCSRERTHFSLFLLIVLVCVA